jgi:hypothetical protein
MVGHLLFSSFFLSEDFEAIPTWLIHPQPLPPRHLTPGDASLPLAHNRPYIQRFVFRYNGISIDFWVPGVFSSRIGFSCLHFFFSKACPRLYFHMRASPYALLRGLSDVVHSFLLQLSGLFVIPPYGRSYWY